MCYELEHPVYSVPIVQQDLRQEETILQIADALDYLDQVVNDIFDRVQSRIEESKAKLERLHKRESLAKLKVEKLTGSSKATKVFSSAKYPASGVYSDYHSIFKSDVPLRFNRCPTKIRSRHTPLEGRVLQEKLQFYHVKVSNKLLHRNVEITPDEGLGSLPRDLDSVSSLLLFNTSENPYRQYVMLDPLGAVTKTRKALDDEEEQKMEAAPISISQREVLDHPAGENYFYSPGLGEVPQIDVPLDLPDLPGVADDLRYSMDLGPMIAPSVSSTPAIPELPNLVPESPTLPVENTTPPPHAPVPPAFLPPPPPPPPPPAAAPPPPPPPPPPPVIADPQASQEPIQSSAPSKVAVVKNTALPVESSGDARASLMEAIRQAGGSGKAKLRSAKDMKIEAKKKKQEQKAIGGGGDLMADLHAKLSMRRKGISGGNKLETSVGGAMERVSAMIPQPTLADPGSSNTEDDEDWE